VFDARVKVTNAEGTPVSDVTVTGQWAGLISGTTKAVTGNTGWATLTSAPATKSGDLTFHVTDLAKAGSIYGAGWNMTASASIQAAQSAWGARFVEGDTSAIEIEAFP
jgi:hypothetical protein